MKTKLFLCSLALAGVQAMSELSAQSCSASINLQKDNSNALLWYAYPTVTGTAPFSYFWQFGDGSTSYQPYPIHTYANVGNYQICLSFWTADSCTKFTCDSTYKVVSPNSIQTLIVVNPATGIEENTVSVTSVFPNPSNDMMEISLSQLVQGELKITDIIGREVYEEKINANNVRVNVSTLPVGYYNISIVSGTKTIHEKIMIAR